MHKKSVIIQTQAALQLKIGNCLKNGANVHGSMVTPKTSLAVA